MANEALVAKLKSLCKENDISVNQALLQSGVGKDFVSNAKRGSVPSAVKIQRLAEFFNVSADYLLSTDVPIANPLHRPALWGNNAELLKKMGGLKIDQEYYKVPVLGDVSAGFGCFAEDNVVGYEEVPANSINPYEKYIFLRVDGDSMFPMLQENDLVLIRIQPSVDSGSYAVVTVDEEAGVIKRVIYGPGWIELHSENPTYPVRRFVGEDIRRIRVVGLLIESKRKFNNM